MNAIVTRLGSTLLALLALATSATAQPGDAGGDPGIDPPSLIGQWSGPYPLESAINDGNPDEWAEIVHMTALPPPQ